MAKSFKKYGKYINSGEMISFSFLPQENKIAGYTKREIPFANNEIKLTEGEAKQMAQNYLKENLKKNEIEEMKVTIEIVNPSIDTRKSLGVGQVYTVAEQTRLAYVCEFNDSYQTTVKVDCTTGDILGYDMLN